MVGRWMLPDTRTSSLAGSSVARCLIFARCLLRVACCSFVCVFDSHCDGRVSSQVRHRIVELLREAHDADVAHLCAIVEIDGDHRRFPGFRPSSEFMVRRNVAAFGVAFAVKRRDAEMAVSSRVSIRHC
jgi:hypothetical protein